MDNISLQTSEFGTNSNLRDSDKEKTSKQVKKKCSGFCVPLLILIILYIINVVLSLIFAKSGGIVITNIIVSTIFYAIFGIGIYLLCSNCLRGWSWIILLFFIFIPFIIIFLLMIFVFGFFVIRK